MKIKKNHTNKTHETLQQTKNIIAPRKQHLSATTQRVEFNTRSLCILSCSINVTKVFDEKKRGEKKKKLRTKKTHESKILNVTKDRNIVESQDIHFAKSNAHEQIIKKNL